jgi:ABC-type molybdate transport system substrate-binding protein
MILPDDATPKPDEIFGKDNAKKSGPSTELLKYLESPEAAAVFKRDGFDPPPPASG